MKKIRRNSKKGFTLVELIVVLVILAILAAMLVPALTGYIRRARQEKDFQAASEVLVAAQALVTEYYGTTTDDPPTVNGAQSYVTVDRVNELTGLGLAAGSITSVTVNNNTDWTVTGLTVAIGSGTYTWNGSTWTAAS